MPLTIGELAKRTGVNRETVRYYERRRRCRGSRHLLPLQRYDQAPAILFHENIDDVLTSSQPFAHANALLNRIASPLQRQNHHAFKDGACPGVATNHRRSFSLPGPRRPGCDHPYS